MKLFRLFVVACILTFCAGRAAAQEQETPAPKTYKIYAVCDAHLDTQWNWDLTHTIREYIPRILFQNLWMLERYPDYKFNFEGGIIYRWMKEYYPLHYARLQKYIDEGRWHISGASWNANDPNMPSAESFIRNILQGQELYKREFGVRSTDIFLPDCFGFGYTLPSLAAHCGLIGFSTQKLSWRKHDFFPDAPYHKKNPFSWGVWYGIDGQSLMAAFDTGGYTAELPADAGYNKDFIRRASNGFDNTAMRYYSGGHLHGTTNCGDKGNSGTVTTARRMAEAMADPDAPVQLISATSDQLFLDYMDRRDELPTYDGELLMDVHAGGCYTSQGAMKYYNRRNEELLGAAERAAAKGKAPAPIALPDVFAEAFTPNRLYAAGDALWMLPEQISIERLHGLRVLRTGLLLAHAEGKRSEPDHALAMALRPEEAAHVANLTIEQALAYQAGETLALGNLPGGYTLLCCEGVSLGWGKQAGGLMKNHYPKGLRRR